MKQEPAKRPESRFAASPVQPSLPSMRIGVIAPCAVPIPPPRYGGIEMVVDQLLHGIAAHGHEPVLFTVGESTHPAERRWSFEEAAGTPEPPMLALRHSRDAYKSLRDVDVIHDHTSVGPTMVGSHPAGIPVAATLHGECIPTQVEALSPVDDRVSLIAISHDQRRSAPGLRFRQVIHHGLDVKQYSEGDGSGDYVLFLGRMEPTKGAHRAIDIARKAGHRILIAAKMWEPSERAYFSEYIEPRLGPDAEYIGEVGPEQKIELLQAARALVNPIRWREPFGLVMIESLACGTPVLAFPAGAAPEIVDDGVTGYLRDDENELADALAAVDQLSRDDCRDAAVRRFSTERMVLRHLALYAAMLGSERFDDGLIQAE